MSIIGITGLKRSGKDTIGDYLNTYGYEKLSFAHKLKEIIDKYLECKTYDESDREDVQVFNVKHSRIIAAGNELGLDGMSLLDITLNVLKPFETYVTEDSTTYRTSYRAVMQSFGTDACRSLNDDVWVEYLINKIKLNPNKRYVITDVRFDNEAVALKNIGAKIIKVERNIKLEDSHSSEKGISTDLVDKVVINTTFEQLYSQLDSIV